MDLKGIKGNFLGDSITAGHGVEDIDHNLYWQRLGKECGMAAYRGYGVAATRIAYQHFPSEDPAWDYSFIDRVDDMDLDAELIVIFGGTNDFGNGDAPLGIMSDRSPYTFYGACHVLINKLINRYVEAQLVFITPLHRMISEKGERKLKDYVKAIREVAEFYSIPVLDLYATSGLQPQVPIIQEKFCPDGLHPNDSGHEKIYKRLRAFLEAL